MNPQALKPPLPADVARCPGIGSDAEGWHDECQDCRRRTCRPGYERQVWMSPPPLVVFFCEFLIEPGEA